MISQYKILNWSTLAGNGCVTIYCFKETNMVAAVHVYNRFLRKIQMVDGEW